MKGVAACFILIFVSAFIHKAEGAAVIGLAKKAEITGIISGYNVIEQTYYIQNSGTENLTNIFLQDNISGLFQSIIASVTNYDVQITSVSGGASLSRNAAYNGSGNLLGSNGSMPAGSSAVVALTYRVKLTAGYDGRNFAQAAFIEAFYNSNTQSVYSYSVDGDTPKPNPNPDDLTEIKLRQITIEGPATISVSENPSKTLTFTISSKGEALSQVKAVFKPTKNGATLSDAPGNYVDAWASGGTFSGGEISYTLNFNLVNTTATLSINIVDDDMYELDEYFLLELIPLNNNVSLLQSSVETKITSDDSPPEANISQNGPSQVWEGTGPGYHLFNIEVTLSNASYLPVEVDWWLTPDTNIDFSSYSGTITFNPGEKSKMIPLEIIQDNIVEKDKQFTVHIKASKNAKNGTNTGFRFTLLDDDLRQIAWLNNTPKSLSGRLDAGSGIIDVIELHFKVVRGALDNPTVEVTLPAGITYVSYENVIDNASTFGVSNPVINGNVLTFTVNTVLLEQDQMVHFKITRKAECSAALGAKNDAVKVLTPNDPNGVEEQTNNINQAGRGDRIKYTNYNVYKGNLMMTWVQGSNLTFLKSEMGVAKVQALTIKNTGDGKLTVFNFVVQITSGIGILQNAKIRGTTRTLTFSGPTTANGLDTYLITLSDADFRTIGNRDRYLDYNESMTIEFEFKSPDALICGPRKETIWVEWECQKPATTLYGNLSIFEPTGKPELVRTLKSPANIVENGNANNFVLTLQNKGQDDAYYVNIPFTLKAENEWINTNEVTITLDSGTPSYDPIASVQNAQSLTITNLIIPSGRTATITYPVRRKPMERYTAATTDMLSGAFFCYVESGTITYSDFCREPGKTATIGSAFFNSYNSSGIHIGSQNTSYIPELMTADIVRIDVQENSTKTIFFEFGNLTTVFPMYDAQNWFGNQKSTTSKVIITFHATNNLQLTGAKIFSGINPGKDLGPLITQSGTTYTIEIPYNFTTADYFSKNGKAEFYVQGICYGVSTLEHNLSYTVDFVSNANVTHKLYKKTYPEVFVKCSPDEGVSLRSLTVKRINYLKGDANDDGIDNNDVAVPSQMNLDRFYHNDTLEIEYKVKVGRNYTYDAACNPNGSANWNYLYLTMGNLDRDYFEPIESEYEIYHDGQNVAYETAASIALTGDDGNNKDSSYLQIRPLSGDFTYRDSVIVRSRWRVKTITGNQWEKSFQMNFWVHCEINPQSGAQVFKPRPTTACDEFAQNYEKEYANVQLYSLWHDTNGPQQYRYVFTDYKYKNIVYDYHLSIGVSGFDNNNFLHELRQPYYTDSMSYTIPYGYLLVTNTSPAPVNNSIYFFGDSIPRMVYDKYYYPVALGSLPEMQGTKKELNLKSLWDTDLKSPHNVALGQIADEGWQAKPFFTLRPTPRAEPGEKTVYVRLPYESPSNLPKMVNNQAGFILYNDAATFILSCSAPEAIAYTGTVKWPVRVTNTSSVMTAKKGWIYIDGIDMEGVQLTTLDGTVIASSGQGYQKRWLWVGDIPANTFKDFILVAKYNKFHCDRDSLHITPWYDYADEGDDPFTVTLPTQKFDYKTVPLDTTDVATNPKYDDHVGRSVELYVVNPLSEISGSITPLTDTPTDPQNPASATFGSDIVIKNNTFPVEMLVSSNDILGVKNVAITLNIPAGLSYVHDSAYYQWKGIVQKVAPAAETKLRTIVGGPTDISLKIPLEDFTGHTADTLKGTYNTVEQDRELYLRFKLKAECDNLVADSILLSVKLNGSRLCGDPATGDGMAIFGQQVYVKDFRNYQMYNDVYAPDGTVFGLCTDELKKRTLRVGFTRIGAGELQDKFELILPAYLNLEGSDPVKYITSGIDPLLNPIVLSDNIIGGYRIITWQLPKEYSKESNTNIDVEYSVDVILDTSTTNFPPSDTIFANVLAETIYCPNDPVLLAADTLYISTYTSQIGLTKDVAMGPLTADNYYQVTYTYFIKNYSNGEVSNILLSDDLGSLFGDMIEMKDFNIPTPTYAAGDTVAVDIDYSGSGNIITSGRLSANGTAMITVSFLAKPTVNYDGRKFKNNANIIAYNPAKCTATDVSTWNQPGVFDPDISREPDNTNTTDIEPSDAPFNGDGNPNNNDVKTPISFSSIRFKQYPAQYLVNENYLLDDPTVSPVRTDSWLEIIIERVGDLSPYSIDLGFSTDPVFLAAYGEATLGTSNAPCIDAQPAPANQTIQFVQGQKEASVRIEIVDDKIHEQTEAFLARIHNVQGAQGIAIVNDTVAIIITDNDPRPTVNITALADSIKEGTILPAPAYGCTDMQFRIALSNPTYEAVSVQWSTTGGTATAVDYVNKTEIINFNNSCMMSDTVVSLCVIADSIPESAKTAERSLSILTPLAVRAGTLTAISTIVDDDIKVDTLAIRHLICKGDGTGMIVVKARGGETGSSAGRYHYRWAGPGGYSASSFTAGNDTIKNLQAGIYTLTVTDVWSNPTSVSLNIEVKEPANALDITVDDVKDVTCNGDNNGYIHTTISGGWNSPNYQIQWTKENGTFTADTDDIDNISGGTYHLTVSDSAQCTVNKTVVVAEPLPLAISDTVIHFETCKGNADGMISLTVTGGKQFPAPSNPYLVSWTGPSIHAGNSDQLSLSGLLPGTYTVTIADDGCGSLSASFVIEGPATELTVSLESTDNVPCKGDATGKASIKAEGGWGKYVYLWSDGITVYIPDRNDLKAGTYSVIVTDSAGCTRTVSPVTIEEPAEKMVVTLVVTDETYQNGNDGTILVNVIGGVPAYSYSWADVTGLNTNYRDHLEAGTYFVEVTDQWGCLVADTAVITEPSVIDNLPNAFTPDGDGYNDKLLEGFHIKVFDRWGLLLYEGTDGWDGRYKGKMVTSGTYFYVLIDDATGKEYKSAVLLQTSK